MKKLFALIAALALSSAALAAPEAVAPAKTAQQSKMATCSAEGKGKKGDEYKAFIKECLSSKPVKTLTPQQAKMKACGAEAKGKKGAEHKAFMKTCLSNKT